MANSEVQSIDIPISLAVETSTAHSKIPEGLTRYPINLAEDFNLVLNRGHNVKEYPLEALGTLQCRTRESLGRGTALQKKVLEAHYPLDNSHHHLGSGTPLRNRHEGPHVQKIGVQWCLNEPATFFGRACDDADR